MSDTLKIEFPPPEVSQEDCDFILGQYMRGWNQVEYAVRYTIWTLLRTDQQRAEVFTLVLQMAALRSLMTAIASYVIRDKTELAEFYQLMEELKRLAGIRNRLVHGTWKFKFEKDASSGKITKSEIVRYSPVTDREDNRILHSRTHQKSKKLEERHEFSPDRMLEETLKLRPFCDRLRAFMDRAKIAPLEPLRISGLPPTEE